MASRQWKGTTFGSGGMHETLISILKFTDQRIIYLFAAIFVVPVCIAASSEARAPYGFFRQRLGYGPLKSALALYRNHCLFAQVVIDRFAMYAGNKFEVEIDSKELFDERASKDDGFVLLSSHIGNYEMAGYTLGCERKSINAVVYAFEKETVMKNRGMMFKGNNVNMIAMREDMGHLFEIDQTISRGDIVSFPADRFVEGARCLKMPFFGKEASFPQGPFSVAAMRGVDALAVNVMKVGLRRYRIYLKDIPYDRSLSRKEQTEALCRGYVNELERILKIYPTQWYNYYDFWA